MADVQDAAELSFLTKLRAAASEMLNRAIFAGRAGLTFNGRRDIYEVGGYKRFLQPADFRARYERDGIAARIVESYPKATWRGSGGELIENEDSSIVTAFEAAWFDLDKRLKIWPMFQRADIMAGLGRYSVMFIGAVGNPEEPLPKPLRPELIQYLSVFGEENARIVDYDRDNKSSRFGQPIKYELIGLEPPTTGNSAFSLPTNTQSVGASRRVHWTRVVHIADGLLDSLIFGASRLQKPWNRLDDLEKVLCGGSESFWMQGDRGMQVEVDPEAAFEDEDKEALKNELEEYEHGRRRLVRTRGVTMTPLNGTVANFALPVESLFTILAAMVAIPKRILMGSERGDLASTQDRDNWIERVEDRRNEYAGPLVVRPFIDRLIEYGALPEPDDYDVRWPSIHDMPEEEKAALAKTYAEINGTNPVPVITADEIRDRVFGWAPLADVTDEDVDQLKSSTPAPNPNPLDPNAKDPNAQFPRAAALRRALLDIRTRPKKERRHLERKVKALLFLHPTKGAA
jgi:hypothetical protein